MALSTSALSSRSVRIRLRSAHFPCAATTAVPAAFALPWWIWIFIAGSLLVDAESVSLGIPVACQLLSQVRRHLLNTSSDAMLLVVRQAATECLFTGNSDRIFRS